MFGDVSPHVLLQMELIVRASSTPKAALAPVIALLVDGNAAKRAAIVEAFSANDPLREQWEQAWAALRR
ncbi:MAG: hypothetical protein JWM25_498 [Thermoleophilia bacterium]|nr:hypothetical protein [Thermoleophilia bacterium]MCZ4495915.1 hypothetical protein [Thermoleophilia bacterium]